MVFLVFVDITADDPSWNIATKSVRWKRPKGTRPKVKFKLNETKEKFSLSVSKFDFDGIPSNPIEIRVPLTK